MTDPRYPHTAYAYKIGPSGEEIPLTDDEMKELDDWNGRALAKALQESATHTKISAAYQVHLDRKAGIPPEVRAALELRRRREDTLGRACAQVALSKVNKVLRIK